MVAFDASLLIDLFNPNLQGKRRQRIDLLMESLDSRRQKIIVPSPAYSEFLIGASKARDDYERRIEQSSIFRVEPFGKRAALECALVLGKVLSAKERRSISKTKVKFDWMIVSIAKTTPGITHIYAGDADIVRCAKSFNLAAIHTDELPLPVQQDWVAEQGLHEHKPDPT